MLILNRHLAFSSGFQDINPSNYEKNTKNSKVEQKCWTLIKVNIDEKRAD